MICQPLNNGLILLDHGNTVKQVKNAWAWEYPPVMYDSSRLTCKKPSHLPEVPLVPHCSSGTRRRNASGLHPVADFSGSVLKRKGTEPYFPIFSISRKI
ncbi:MAG: hypothetical protein E7058_06630 [Lentisphaerae bacterium]|nr:hypothetical protein [Lentisphaerota bacterium]